MPHDEREYTGCHTLGNLLQTYLLSDPDVSFASYAVPTPMEQRVVLKIATHTGSITDAIARARSRICDDLLRVERDVFGAE